MNERQGMVYKKVVFGGGYVSKRGVDCLELCGE